MIERVFIKEHVNEALIDEYLKSKLTRAGYSHMEMKKTPIGTRIIVYAEKPGLVIGRRGRLVKELTETIAKEFGVENPQIEVKQIENPDLDPAIVAQKIASALERGMHFRRVAHAAVRRVMGAGAKGVVVIISGKLTGERARTEKFMEGYMKHCGEPSEELVRKAHRTAKLKLGVIGVTVKLVPPDVILPDEVVVKEEEGEKREEIGEVEEQ
ncbi:MAG TPA: 30S ribosomal protein S3 [Methanothermococcus okinawensis]|uniref:Small ribosomal subunit protein uS3 n=1 Tax=Methanothermococcus okinawensis TaxID=155863 RepID=A0A832ZCK7_9EURY|nr:30S ribosomal protein S3 [Methanococcaceae archaeon]HIP84941.1 30S ribosomal protein S3 [Methanothermococcus okinawensis]HIP91297.1 30S ribosomal protein S3 [Methanothermococcus okinawensis]